MKNILKESPAPEPFKGVLEILCGHLMKLPQIHVGMWWVLVSSCIWQIVMVNRTEQELIILLIVLVYFLLQLGTIHWLIKSPILTLYYQVVNRKNYDTIKTIF